MFCVVPDLKILGAWVEENRADEEKKSTIYILAAAFFVTLSFSAIL
jgi:hypothetical protein